MYFSLLFVAPILFWNDTSENTHFPSPWGDSRQGERGKTSHVEVFQPES